MKITPITSYNISMSGQDMYDMVNDLNEIPPENLSERLKNFMSDIRIMLV